ncbi:hypothetical protein [Ferrimonas sp.]|uniref:hypothetical protein n=1 Tax=Ferrimonas sp. TaxID=2080861 RepID=UPI003A8E20BF
MDALTLVSNSIEHLAWPIAAVVLALILKEPLKELLQRLTKANVKGSEFNFATPGQQRIESPESNSAIADSVPADPLGLQTELEKRIYADLESRKLEAPEDKVTVLVKHHAALQLKNSYIIVYNQIFGSQISALQSLNIQTEPVGADILSFFYAAAYEKSPDVYKNYSFQQYLDYLTGSGLVGLDERGYFITNYGRGFLMFLSETGLTTNRAF